MGTTVDSSDGDLARAVEERTPGLSEAAESELYRRFAPRVRLYGRRHLRDEDAAWDLVQQVMLLTIRKLREGSIRDTDRIASFIFGTSRTMANDLRRRERRRERLRETFLDVEVCEPPREAMLDLDRLEACLARLAERERAVVLLTFYAEKAAGDVAREIGVSGGNVRVIRHRAIERLRGCMASSGPVQ
jgi:RNA polymerase sigma-70 factor, ECF subfamily